jgi:hypothetical protein
MNLDRFFAKVNLLNTGCWQWTGHLNASGYPVLKHATKTMLAHRWAWEFIANESPAQELHHVCEMRSCVNPAHLQAATIIEHPDKPSTINRHKTHCPNGHEFAGENLYIDKDGYRHCRECRRRSSVAFYRANKDAIRKYQNHHYRIYGRPDR